MKTMKPYLKLAVLLGAMVAAKLHAQTRVFTYQGQLSVGGIPYSGPAEFQPTLWDAASGCTTVAASVNFHDLQLLPITG